MANRKDNRALTIISKVIRNIKGIIFYIILGIIVLIFIFNQILAIWLAGFFFVIYLVSYLITLSSKRKLLIIMQEYSFISDKEISDKMQRPIEDIRKILKSLSKNQKNKKWLIVFLNSRYIILNENGVQNFKELYERGYNEKQILEDLQHKMNIRSRAEVKAIELTLANHKRLLEEDRNK